MLLKVMTVLESQTKNCFKLTWKNFGLKVCENFGRLCQDFVSLLFLSDIKQHLKLINDSITTEAQLRELKRFGNLISPANCKDQNENIANKLIRIFFQEKLKHPVKSIIQRYELYSLLYYEYFIKI